MEAKMPIISTTTNSSISVNPFSRYTNHPAKIFVFIWISLINQLSYVKAGSWNGLFPRKGVRQHFFGAGGTQGLGAAFQCSAGGGHVVHQQNDFPFDVERPFA